MDFFINKGSNYPELIMELIKDNHNDYEDFFIKLQGADIKFSMYDVDTKRIKVVNQNASCHKIGEGEEYGIGYKFKYSDVDRIGTFTGKFTITYQDGTNEKLIVPIKEYLKIHVI